METPRQKPLLSENSQQEFYFSCPSEFEDLLRNEIDEIIKVENLKVSDIYTQRGGVSVFCGFADIIKISLHVRTASKVFWSAFKFKFRREDDLHKKALKLNWTKVLHSNLTLKIDTSLDSGAKSLFRNSHFLSLKLKDSIVDYYTKKNEPRPSIDLNKPDVQILNKITYKHNSTQAHILIDLFGEPLSNRGYRQKGHEAPLRENLSAAIAKTISPQKDDCVIDSMCGSGTFLIESFLFTNGISPKYLKLDNFLNDQEIWSFSKIPAISKNKSLLRQIKSYCQSLARDNIQRLHSAGKSKYYGHDISEQSVRLARETVQKAKLDKFISIEKIDATRLRPMHQKGIIFCNPPYGERMGDVERLEQLYYDYGENLKKHFKNFDAWIFTSKPELRKKISLRTSQRVKFYNGPMECRLLQYKLY